MHAAVLENRCLEKKKSIFVIDIKMLRWTKCQKAACASLGQKYRSTPAVAHAWLGNF